MKTVMDYKTLKLLRNFGKLIFKFLIKELNYYQILFKKNGKSDLFNVYKNFIIQGKGIRGGLVLMIDKIFKGKEIDQNSLFCLAGGIEILHSSLLIQDDIMDEDKMRRDGKTINFYFEEKFKKLTINPKHLGESFAINFSDIGFFIAFDLLGRIRITQQNRINFYNFIVKEYLKVSIGQIDDIFFSQTNKEPSEKEIIRIYLYKTARYTFVIPIISTLFLKNNTLASDKKLIKILEELGIIFQITDDLIGFLSDETGKDIASDIRENKKTLIRKFLLEEIKDEKLKKFFGKKDLNIEEIKTLREFYKNSQTKIKIEKIIQEKEKNINKNLEKIKAPNEFKKLIYSLIEYLKKREK